MSQQYEGWPSVGVFASRTELPDDLSAAFWHGTQCTGNGSGHCSRYSQNERQRG